jgi:hypothetical protein
MQFRIFKKITLSLLVIGLVGLSGCGAGDDLLDEPGQRYMASIAIQDLDSETLTVDVIRNYCDNDVEDYGPASAAVNFTVDSNAPGITLQSYSLEYIPLESEDGTGTIVMPPALDGPLNGGNLGIDILSGGSASFEITCMSTDTKEEYRTKVGWLLYSETPGGLAAIAAKEVEVAAKEVEIDAKNDEIDDKEDEIAAAILAGTPTAALEVDLSRLEEDLADLEAELAELEIELAALPFSLWSEPELDEGRYKIRITFEFEDEFGEDRTIVREATVWLGNYDNC